MTGSPASPATPVAGESLFAAMGSTNFTLLETPSFGTLSGSTYSGAANSIPYVSPLVTDEIMYAPSQPTTTEAADGYVDNDFEYLELYNRSSSPVTLSNYFVCNGVGYTPGWIPDGSLANNLTNSEFETLASGATATWSASNVTSGTYTVYAHLNLYDGDNNPVSPDSQAQYTVTCGGVPTTVTIDQQQTPTTLSVTSLTYNNTSGLVTAAANNSIINNNSLVAGSIVHISGAAPSQYDGTFVVQSATATSFTYSLASGLNLAAATGTISAGLNDVWISLGTYAASGTVSVVLTRTTNAHPSEWTIAGGMELVSSQQTVVLGTPAFGNTNAVPTPPATLAAGQYAVIVSNYAAFEERYNPTGSSNILVLGVYSGHLSNGGDTVDIYQIGSRAAGDVTALNGYVPFYRVDHINYNNAAPWPTAADGDGPALIRIHAADYGNDAINWEASNSGGTPGQANLVIDTLPPTVPTNLAGQALLSPTSEVSLAWSASSDPRSNVAYYEIYRGAPGTPGLALGTSSTTSYADTTIAAGTNYTYTVAAVNRDGYSSAQSTSITIGLPSAIANSEPTATQIAIYFSEPLTTTSATTLSNYGVSGETVSSVVISRHNTEVYLTLSAAMTLNSSYTVTMKNLTTVSGDQLPATDTYTFTYALPAWTATMYQANWGTLGSLTDATSVVQAVADQSWSQAFTPATLNFTTGNGTGLGHFTNDTLMPTQTSLSEDLTDIVITASAAVYVPAAGNYTFNVSSDDGFGLTIPGVTFTTLTNATNSAGSDQLQYNGAGGPPTRWAWPTSLPPVIIRSVSCTTTAAGPGRWNCRRPRAVTRPGRAPSSWSATRPTAAWPWATRSWTRRRRPRRPISARP